MSHLRDQAAKREQKQMRGDRVRGGGVGQVRGRPLGPFAVGEMIDRRASRGPAQGSNQMPRQTNKDERILGRYSLGWAARGWCYGIYGLFLSRTDIRPVRGCGRGRGGILSWDWVGGSF